MIKGVLLACILALALSRRTWSDEEVNYHEGVAGPAAGNPWGGAPIGSPVPGSNPWNNGPAPNGANPWGARPGAPTGPNPWGNPAGPGAPGASGPNQWGPAPNQNFRPGQPGPNPWQPTPGAPGAPGAWGPNPNVRPGSPGPVPSPWGPNPNFRPGVSNIRPGTPVTSSGVNFDDFMMRLSGSGLNCPGVRVSVRRGFGRQEYKYEGPIQLSCVVGSRTVQQGTCYNYRECSQLICRFTSCKSKGGNVRKRRL